MPPSKTDGSINPYFHSPPPSRIRHPLEENILTSLIVTLIAILIALIVGIPLLIFTAFLLLIGIGSRYLLLTIHSIAGALAFLCLNRIHSRPANRTPPPLLPTTRLAAGNDIRWLGKRSNDGPEPLIQTLLLLEGTMTVSQFRSILVARVLGATTNDHLLYPRFTQILRPRLGGYIWETDAEFAIQNHVFPVRSGIQGEEGVQAWIGQLSTQRLNPDRPLWEIQILSPYGSFKDTLLLVRTHLALGDGASLLRILTHALADRQNLHPHHKATFGAVAFSFNLLRSLIVGPLTLALWLFTTSKDRNPFTYVPPKIRTDEFCSKDKLGTVLDSCWQVAWSAGLSTAKVSRVKQIMRCSFNDVLLSATAGSLRKFLQTEGISYPSNLKAVIPVDLRSSSPISKRRPKRLGWKVASILTPLPTGLEGAIPRLWATRQRLDEVKASADPVVAYGTTAIMMSLFPQSIGAALLDSITNKASVQVASVQGPETLLSIGGFVIKGIYPFLPPPGNLRLALTLFSYVDQIHVTAFAHPTLRNAPISIIKGINLQIEQLSRQLSQRKVPGESRRLNKQISAALSEEIQRPTHQIHVKLQVVQEELRFLSTNSNGEISEGEGQRSKLDSLKSDYHQLMGELKRRSSIVEGVSLSFEDEETIEEFRKPRKRALSVVSVSARRSSLFPPGRSLLPSDSTLSFHSSDSSSPPTSHNRNSGSRSPIRTTAV